MKKRLFVIVMLIYASVVYAGEVVPLPVLTNPDSIAVDDRHIYITEFPVIYIYSLKDYTLKTKFGRRGEGPSEFLKFAQLYVRPDGLVVGDRNRVLYFDRGGTYLKEIKARSMAHWGVMPLGNGFIGRSKAREGKVEYDTVVGFGPGLEKGKEIYRSRFFYTEWKGGKKCNAIDVTGIHFQSYGNRIFIKGGTGFTIHVFGEGGDKLYSINREYEKVGVTESDKKRYREYFRLTRPWKGLYEERLKNEIYFPDFFPAIRSFLVADEKIYVSTYKRVDGKSQFIVLNLKGEFIEEILIPFDAGDQWFFHTLMKSVVRRVSNPTFTIGGGTFYQLIENSESEEWELHIHKLDHLRK